MNSEEIVKDKIKSLAGQRPKEESLSDVSIVITAHNQKDWLLDIISAFLESRFISDIVVIDNYSADGTEEILKEIGANYVFFDEGIQSWGSAWNVVCKNFPLKEYVIFADPGFLPNTETLLWLLEVLKKDDTGACGVVFDSNSSIGRTLDNILNNDLIYSDILSPFGYFWGIRRDLLEKTEGFDEELFDPDNVLLDFSIKLLEQGYKGRISECSYVKNRYGYLTTKEIFAKHADDLGKLRKSYSTNYFNRSPNFVITDIIADDDRKNLRLLEVGCDLGANLMDVKRFHPDYELFGTDLNENSVGICSKLLNVKIDNIEKMNIPFDGKFDYIIFGDVLEHLHNTEEVVEYCKKILNPNGKIIASIPNLMHISVMEKLVNGRFEYEDAGLLDRTHVHFFTFYEIKRMFEENGFMLESVKAIEESALTLNQEKVMNALLELSDKTDENMYTTTQYVITAKVRQ